MIVSRAPSEFPSNPLRTILHPQGLFHFPKAGLFLSIHFLSIKNPQGSPETFRDLRETYGGNVQVTLNCVSKRFQEPLRQPFRCSGGFRESPDIRSAHPPACPYPACGPSISPIPNVVPPHAPSRRAILKSKATRKRDAMMEDAMMDAMMEMGRDVSDVEERDSRFEDRGSSIEVRRSKIEDSLGLLWDRPGCPLLLW